jgi:hypothetical protein
MEFGRTSHGLVYKLDELAPLPLVQLVVFWRRFVFDVFGSGEVRFLMVLV